MSSLRKNRILLVKPPDPFLENEFVYQQLGPNYLQSYLKYHGFEADHLILFEKDSKEEPFSGGWGMIHETNSGEVSRSLLDLSVFSDYDLIALSVMTPQSPGALKLTRKLREQFPHLPVAIGGSHARYYLNEVKELKGNSCYDYIIPQDGWEPLYQIMENGVSRQGEPQVLSHKQDLRKIPVGPTRYPELMKFYEYTLGGLPGFHTVTALGCPFTCHFCEAGLEAVRTFSKEIIEEDLKAIANAHRALGREEFALMFFDDVGLMSPRQVHRLSEMIRSQGFASWRAFTHAYLVVRYGKELLAPFRDTGGQRIGIGIETGSQKSLDLINKRNGRFQDVREHFEAVQIANSQGIAVDAFTMIYPWEDEGDLLATDELVKFIIGNPVEGRDSFGRPLKNYVDSTIMMPYQGTRFYEMILGGEIEGVSLNQDSLCENGFYKGVGASSGWAYDSTVLPREIYLEAQENRNALRPEYR